MMSSREAGFAKYTILLVCFGILVSSLPGVLCGKHSETSGRDTDQLSESSANVSFADSRMRCRDGSSPGRVRGFSRRGYICGTKTGNNLDVTVTNLTSSRMCFEGKEVYLPGEVVPAMCPEVCLGGLWVTLPCPMVCEYNGATYKQGDHWDSPEGCDMRCKSDLIMTEGDCSPMKIPAVYKPSPGPLPGPSCGGESVPGQIRGQTTSGYICGLDDQWFSKSIRGEKIDNSTISNSTVSKVCVLDGIVYEAGKSVPAKCAEMCLAGHWDPISCARSCEFKGLHFHNGQEWRSENGCYMSCDKGLIVIQDDCNVFPPVIANPFPSTQISSPLQGGTPGTANSETRGVESL